MVTFFCQNLISNKFRFLVVQDFLNVGLKTKLQIDFSVLLLGRLEHFVVARSKNYFLCCYCSSCLEWSGAKYVKQSKVFVLLFAFSACGGLRTGTSASFDSLLSRAGLGHLGKGWIVRDTTTRRLPY